MDAPTLSEHGITALPGNLYEAAVAMKNSEVMKECLGDHIHSNLYRNKIKEWDAYRTQITEYELATYLPVL